jgi:hypothetical protein
MLYIRTYSTSLDASALIATVLGENLRDVVIVVVVPLLLSSSLCQDMSTKKGCHHFVVRLAIFVTVFE